MSIEKIGSQRRELSRKRKIALKALIREDRLANREEYWAKRVMLGFTGLMMGLIISAPVAIFIPGSLELGLELIPVAGGLAVLTTVDRLIYLTRLNDSESGLS